ncbi:hypothetical protein EVAR_84492_1 [Eumeta japonica]|uniref:Uncharacterized protein n=1 Tax=Eumeta variegata TaxID=151549 RepID=A0A4C1UJ73_EUMVA|nr:hypothetical protein EVAR_84492_1 [Eumeta japonica]
MMPVEIAHRNRQRTNTLGLSTGALRQRLFADDNSHIRTAKTAHRAKSNRSIRSTSLEYTVPPGFKAPARYNNPRSYRDDINIFIERCQQRLRAAARPSAPASPERDERSQRETVRGEWAGGRRVDEPATAETR